MWRKAGEGRLGREKGGRVAVKLVDSTSDLSARSKRLQPDLVSFTSPPPLSASLVSLCVFLACLWRCLLHTCILEGRASALRCALSEVDVSCVFFLFRCWGLIRGGRGAGIYIEKKKREWVGACVRAKIPG